MPDPDVARLRWRCRRGIKEMDILLERFLCRHYPDLPAAQKLQFLAFLDETDPDIMSWITGTTAPSRPEFMIFVQQLRGLGDAGS